MNLQTKNQPKPDVKEHIFYWFGLGGFLMILIAFLIHNTRFRNINNEYKIISYAYDI